ncbi:tRNA glutamyl-Q(34) synthetase GluQRS [Desulfohalovibrio reitneri]|uniref:tRNA glutamyl-Q(34) synthetase GluQRS n=1 Tax=Desulfohalovibrio reitneri TaxID=1307759 RepID=UPI0004A753AA|nr:tRNA glutamyl-Q(34) synthetase GluQRS [Desulfohalovibrio reitneri]
MKPPPRGRFAPSPTGRLHLGNAYAFLLAWLASRSRRGNMLMRLEDLDPDRSKPEFERAALDDLAWLGLDWDEGPDKGGPYGPYRQSERLGLYQEAAERLAERGLVYPCYCTRKELRGAASAPHVGDAGPRYPGFCRDLTPDERAEREAGGRSPALRLYCPDGEVAFVDMLRGRLALDPQELGGDFPLRRSDGVWAYQLAVVVDDAAQNVTQVVRGDDLIDSTPRQILLYRMLGFQPPEYLHLPLLLDHEGERLAKRHQSLEIAALREAGARPEDVAGYLAWLAGQIERPEPRRPAELVEGFDAARLPSEPTRLPPDVAGRLVRGAGISAE